MVKNAISNINSYNVYSVAYTPVPVTYDIDSDGKTYISKVSGADIYTDDYDQFLYFSYINIADASSCYAFSQDKSLYLLDNKTGNTDLVLPNTNKIYIYKDIFPISSLSRYKSSSYTINVSGFNLTGLELIEVRFNHNVVKSYNFNRLTGNLELLNLSEIYYDTLNQIDLVYGSKVIDTNLLNIHVDNIPIKKLPIDYDFSDPELVSLNHSIQENGLTVNRIINQDTYTDNKLLYGVTPHDSLQNIKVEIEMKTIKRRVPSTSKYGQGYYGQGYYGGGSRNLEGFTNGSRFRLLMHNIVLNEVIIFNNCKTKMDYNYNFTDVYGLTLKIEANNEITKLIGEDINENNTQEC